MTESKATNRYGGMCGIRNVFLISISQLVPHSIFAYHPCSFVPISFTHDSNSLLQPMRASLSNRYINNLFQVTQTQTQTQSRARKRNHGIIVASSSVSDSEKKLISEFESESESLDRKKPLWMKCINGVSPRTCALNEAVSRISNISLDQANELISIGAVWAKFDAEDSYRLSLNEWGYSTAPTDGYGSFTSENSHDNDSGNESDMDDDLDEYIAKLQYESTYQRLMEHQIIGAGTDIRIYPHPRRFSACYEINQDRLLYEDTTFIVVDKPPMLPTQPDASNYRECCPGCVNDLLGPFYSLDGEKVERPLFCHRVDSCVGGCVVLSKDKNGQKVFSEFQRKRQLKKLYLTLTNKPVPLGQHIHWMFAPTNMRGNQSGPSCQLLSHTPPANRKAAQAWIRCILQVTKSEPIRLPHLNPNQTYYQSTIRLVTGRKHQVRAQLASLGCPIVGDTLYQPIAGMTLDQLENEEGEVEDSMDMAVQKCRIPTEPIGLQAYAILFGGIRAKARTPWWAEIPALDD